jgi:hypothetical protein
VLFGRRTAGGAGQAYYLTLANAVTVQGSFNYWDQNGSLNNAYYRNTVFDTMPQSETAGGNFFILNPDTASAPEIDPTTAALPIAATVLGGFLLGDRRRREEDAPAWAHDAPAQPGACPPP